MTKKILVDCDPGIDDAFAIALAHGTPEVEVVGVTTVAGNVALEHTTENALRLVDYFGMTGIPVARGADVPLVRESLLARDVHGETGLGETVLPEARSEPVDRHAVDFIIETLAASPGEISLVAVGPLTNIALAVRREPRITTWAKEFVVMGGSYTRGNTTPAAEFNMVADPEAAAVALSAAWEPVLIGLDVTLGTRVTPDVRARLDGLGRLGTELLAPCLDFVSRHRQYSAEGPAVHDACAVASVIDPALFTTVSARVDVETHGRFTSGMTVTDFDQQERHNVRVATSLELGGFWELMISAFGRINVSA